MLHTSNQILILIINLNHHRKSGPWWLLTNRQKKINQPKSRVPSYASLQINSSVDFHRQRSEPSDPWKSNQKRKKNASKKSNLLIRTGPLPTQQSHVATRRRFFFFTGKKKVDFLSTFRLLKIKIRFFKIKILVLMTKFGKIFVFNVKIRPSFSILRSKFGFLRSKFWF